MEESSHKRLSIFKLKIIVLVILSTSYAFLLSGCTSTQKVTQKSRKTGMELDTTALFRKDLVGFALYDFSKGKMVYEHNASKYFTPASNNKLLTFYGALKLLPDSIPSLKYIVKNDSLIFWGTGDPTFLYPYFKQQRTYSFLKNSKEKLFYSPDNYVGKPLGPGWSWDDYNYYYSAEKAPFPIYGDLARFKVNKVVNYRIDIKDGKPVVQPPYFASHVQDSTFDPYESDLIVRNRFKNHFIEYPQSDTMSFEEEIPFKYSPSLFVKLLGDTLHKKVHLLHIPLNPNAKTLYGVPSDSVYKRMLLVSDNFIAEQLLLLCSSRIGDTLNSMTAIHYIEEHYLQNLPDKPVWVDGSGLSRLDLETPRNMVSILIKLRKLLPAKKLYSMLPTGGESGTLRDWYKAKKPYIHGKTGTLSNNHNLSGYLITKSGKTLIFSLMVNHYVSSTDDVRQEMQNLLWEIHETY